MTHSSIFDMSLAELEKNVVKLENLAVQADELLPGRFTMTEQQVQESDGKFKNGEPVALDSVLDAADARPGLFAALADKDGGKDPKRFETGFLRDQLRRAQLLERVQAALARVEVTHSILHLGEQVKPVMLAAYHVGKVNAPHDDVVAGKMAPALNFYSRIGRKAAETRAANRAPKPEQK